MEIEQRISNQRCNRFLATVSYLDDKKPYEVQKWQVYLKPTVVSA